MVIVMQPFDALSPTVILTAVESVLNRPLTGVITPYNSYVNRVFGVQDDEGTEYVVKFYRPARWTYEAILEEHQFLQELSAADVPVVAPVPDEEGQTLFEIEVELDPVLDPESGEAAAGEILFSGALFPKRGGRTFDAETDEQWLRLGALVGRMHRVGRDGTARERTRVRPDTWGADSLEALMQDGIIHPDCQEEFVTLVSEGLEVMDYRFDGVPVQRIHGDCHRGNILDRSGEGLILIDFDDMMVGPVVQDLWLLLPDYRDQSYRELSLLQEGYQQFMPLPEEQFEMIESLRFLRMLHFLAWQARQRGDQHFQRHFPQWGSRGFWIREVEDMAEQLRRLREE